MPGVGIYKIQAKSRCSMNEKVFIFTYVILTVFVGAWNNLQKALDIWLRYADIWSYRRRNNATNCAIIIAEPLSYDTVELRMKFSSKLNSMYLRIHNKWRQ